MSETAVIDRTARTEHPVIDVLSARWSPRAFDRATSIDEGKLSSALEAARWAPSAYNAQPWRFIVARAGTESFDKIVASLIDFNRDWAAHAPVLVVAIAEVSNADGKENSHAAYDLGQAVAHFSVQAHADGLHVHQMSGFNPEAVTAAFELQAGLLPMTVVAVGEIGDPAALPDALREREHAPRARKPLESILVVND